MDAERSAGEPGGTPRSWPTRLAVAAVVAATAFFAWRAMLGLALLGWDSFPMIVAGRVHGPAGVLAAFGEELMDGRYPLGHFWRPVAELAFALDHAVWGLDAFGYHLTDLLLVALTGVLLAGTCARLFELSGAAARVAGLTAGLAWVLHPVHFEILTAPPRRAESLAVCFAVWALHAHSAAPRSPSVLRRAGVALCCALALASKEAGISALVAVVLCSLCAAAPEPEGPLLRARRAAGATWVAVLATAATLGLRTAVLGGLGGSEQSSLWAGFANARPLLAEYARSVLVPPTVFGVPGNAVVWTALAVFVALVGGFSRVASPGEEGERSRRPGGFAFLALWSATLVAITGMSGIVQGWYALPFVAVFALALGLVAGRGLAAARTRRWPAVPAAATVLAGLGVSLAGSGFFDPARDFQGASELERAFLARFERLVAGADPDTTVRIDNCPAEVWVARDGRFERKIFVLGPYSLEAYAELALPGRPVRVSFPGLPSSLPPRPGEVRVVAVPRSLRFDR